MSSGQFFDLGKFEPSRGGPIIEPGDDPADSENPNPRPPSMGNDVQRLSLDRAAKPTGWREEPSVKGSSQFSIGAFSEFLWISR
jgi:hypothetical protein